MKILSLKAVESWISLDSKFMESNQRILLLDFCDPIHLTAIDVRKHSSKRTTSPGTPNPPFNTLFHPLFAQYPKTSLWRTNLV